MADKTISTYPYIPFAPFDKGIDQEGQKTLLSEGFVSDALNVWFEPGVIRRRGGMTYRDDESGLDNYIFGNLLWEAGTGLTETVLTNDNAYNFSVSAQTYSPLFGNVGLTVEYPCFDSTLLPTLCHTLVPIDTAPDESYLYFTDGKNGLDGMHSVFKYDGTTTYGAASAAASRALGRVDLAGLNGAVQPLGVKQIIYYGDHLMVGNWTATGGKQYKKTVSWGDADTDDIATFVGDSGDKVLTDAKGEILRFLKLGSHLAIYFDRSIVICDPTPGQQIYLFDTRVQGTGLIAPNAVVDVGGMHIFVGQDNIFMYDGGLTPQPIGNRVIKRILEELDDDKKGQTLAHHIPERNLVMFFIPSHDTTWGRYMAAYNYKDGTWTQSRMGYEISSVGYGVQNSSITCETEPWASTACNGVFGDIACSDFRLKPGYRSSVFGVTRTIKNSPDWVTATTYSVTDTVVWTDGKEYENLLGSLSSGSNNPTTGFGTEWIPFTEANYLVDFKEEGDLDLDVPVTAFVEPGSKALGETYGEYGRVLEFIVESKGPSFTLLYSVDQGDTWEVASSDVGGTVLFETTRIVVDFIAQFLTFKIQMDNQNANTQIRVLTAKATTTSGVTLDG